MSRFIVSEPTTTLAIPGGIRGYVRDTSAGGKAYLYFADAKTRRVTSLSEVIKGDPERPLNTSTRHVDKKSKPRLVREVEAALAARPS